MISFLPDTNVVLDVLLRRSEWLADAQVIWDAAISGQIQCHISATSLTDIYYISRRIADKTVARVVVRKCLDVLRVLPVDRKLLETAYRLDTGDFEDDIQATSGAFYRLDAIITRDPRGFAKSAVAVMSPAELVSRLKQK